MQYPSLISIPLNVVDAPPIYVAPMAKGMFAVPVEPPHRHEFQEILWVESGTGRHMLDGVSYDLQPHTLACIARGQIHLFERSQCLQGYYIRFKDEIITQDTPPHTLLLPHVSYGAVIVPDHEVTAINTLFALITAHYTGKEQVGTYAILRHLVHVLLIQCERITYHLQSLTSEDAAENTRIYQHFVHCVEQYYMRQHSVDFYARTMAVLPSRLATVTHAIMGMSPKVVICNRLVLEAQRLLHFTPTAIKDIAQQLGFTDPYHFSKFFKHQVGVSPQLFRIQQRMR